jgi:hypothetical protein
MIEKGILAACGIVLLGLMYCVKPESYPIEPKIEFSRFSRDTISPSDSFSVFINFTDGDGDIGPDPDAPTQVDTFCVTPDSVILKNQRFNFFYRDSRDKCIQYAATPYLSPTGKYKGIKGDIEVKLNASCKRVCSSSPCQDTVSYEIILKDRAGHVSNTITTSKLILKGCI